jgi:NAD(P)-dependent dehydrogenase (short-subunit alcohol dehydrogenase family)
MRNPISAALSGALATRTKHERTVALSDSDRVDGKTALVTGANRGLGKAVAIQLAQRGARVVMACRTGLPEAGEEVARASGTSSIEMLQVDLADLHSVVALCEQLAAAERTLDIVVLNAGVVPSSARPTTQGFELMFGVNYLANVLLVERLMARGVIRPKKENPPRLVFVSSETHRDVGTVEFQSLGHFTPYDAMGSMKVYGYSKLLLEVYAADLSRRLGQGASVHSLCPGAVDTDIAREAPEWVKPALGMVMKKFFRAPHDAAKPVTYLCCARELEGHTGRYLHGMVEKRPAGQTRDTAIGRRLLRDSQRLIARALGETV